MVASRPRRTRHAWPDRPTADNLGRRQPIAARTLTEWVRDHTDVELREGIHFDEHREREMLHVVVFSGKSYHQQIFPVDVDDGGLALAIRGFLDRSREKLLAGVV